VFDSRRRFFVGGSSSAAAPCDRTVGALST
jgi:hypothetical protein